MCSRDARQPSECPRRQAEDQTLCGSQDREVEKIADHGPAVQIMMGQIRVDAEDISAVTNQVDGDHETSDIESNPSFTGFDFASSPESVGAFWLWELAEIV
jgi:hypothetical protein